MTTSDSRSSNAWDVQPVGTRSGANPLSETATAIADALWHRPIAAIKWYLDLWNWGPCDY